MALWQLNLDLWGKWKLNAPYGTLRVVTQGVGFAMRGQIALPRDNQFLKADGENEVVSKWITISIRLEELWSFSEGLFINQSGSGFRKETKSWRKRDISFSTSKFSTFEYKFQREQQLPTTQLTNSKAKILSPTLICLSQRKQR